MFSKRCIFNRKLALNGRSCLLIDFSDDNFPLTVHFRSIGPQTPILNDRNPVVTEDVEGDKKIYNAEVAEWDKLRQIT